MPEPGDLVSCEFDALNHVPRKADLALVAKAVARALRPGGHFCFDVNNRLSFDPPRLPHILPGAENEAPMTYMLCRNRVAGAIEGECHFVEDAGAY